MDRARVEELLAGSPFHRFLGLTLEVFDAEAGTLSLSLDVQDKFSRGDSVVELHGGITAALIDIAGDYAVAIKIGHTVPTINIHVDYLKMVRTTRVVASAKVLRSGRSVGTVDIEVVDENGTLCAVGRGTYSTLELKETAPAKELEQTIETVPQFTSVKLRSADSNSLDKRREAIAIAATEVIARKGFAAATIREIADAAGLHVPTLYQYVTGKDEVLELVYRRVMAEVRAIVDNANKQGGSAREKLVATVKLLVENGDRMRRETGVLNRELKSLSKSARMRVLADYKRSLSRIAEIVEEGVRAGEFRPVEPEIVANFIETLGDVWPLRQFSMRKFGLKKFHAEVEAFIAAALLPRP